MSKQGNHGAAIWPDVASALTSPGLIQLEHYPAPPGLQHFITTLFILRCPEARIRDMLPAAVGYIAIRLEGDCTLQFVGGRTDRTWPETLLAPTNSAVGLAAEGPLAFVAAALAPLGWAALTGLNAGKHCDRADDAAGFLGTEIRQLGDRMRLDWRSGKADGAMLTAALAGIIAPQLRPLNPRHVKLVATVAEWLSARLDPAISELQRIVGYSPRQLERLVFRYYGCGPKLLARKYRALRVMALLQSPETGDQRVAELLNLFYDQSHMIREIRHFAGRTPGQLLDNDASLIATANSLRNYREFRPNIARMPGD